jgi:hypothetical protein
MRKRLSRQFVDSGDLDPDPSRCEQVEQTPEGWLIPLGRGIDPSQMVNQDRRRKIVHQFLERKQLLRIYMEQEMPTQPRESSCEPLQLGCIGSNGVLSN